MTYRQLSTAELIICDTKEGWIFRVVTETSSYLPQSES
jgi:hypothetical protein